MRIEEEKKKAAEAKAAPAKAPAGKPAAAPARGGAAAGRGAPAARGRGAPAARGGLYTNFSFGRNCSILNNFSNKQLILLLSNHIRHRLFTSI